MTEAPTLLWPHQDLRLADRPVPDAAEGPVLPVYVLDDIAPGRRATGGAPRRWLHQDMKAAG